jgi:hypothetical protein
MFFKEALGFAQAFLGKGHRFRFAHWITDEAALMQAVEGIPVMAFPGVSLSCKVR